MISIAPSARISRHADIEESVRGSRLVIEDGVVIDSFVKIKFAGGLGDVLVGAGTYLNSGTVIYSGNGVTIGRNCLVAAGVIFAASNHEYRDASSRIVHQGFLPSRGGISVEDDVWIGANSVLTDGATAGEGSIIAAGSIVRGTLLPYHLYAGQPLRPIRKRL